MVKTYRQSKRFTRVGRSARRKYGNRQMIMKKGRIIHFFKRTFKQEVSITNAGFVAIPSETAAPRYNDFRLDQLPNYTDFTNLYDTYKICGIRRKYVFNRNSSDMGDTTAGHEIPMLITVNDSNDTTALTNENEGLEYASFKQNRLDRPTKRYFRPFISSISAAVPNNNMVRSRWLSTAEPDYIHCGMKEAVDTISSAAGATIGTLCIYTTYYIACRTPK